MATSGIIYKLLAFNVISAADFVGRPSDSAIQRILECKKYPWTLGEGGFKGNQLGE